jgi:hypothetical protein
MACVDMGFHGKYLGAVMESLGRKLSRAHAAAFVISCCVSLCGVAVRLVLPAPVSPLPCAPQADVEAYFLGTKVLALPYMIQYWIGARSTGTSYVT